MYQGQNKRTPLNYALFLLSRRDYGTAEIQKKLIEKFGSTEADEIITQLQEKKFLDDERFVRNYIRSRSSIKSKQYIKIKLQQAKIPTELIEKYLAQEYSQDQELEIIRVLTARYIRKKEGSDNLYQKAGSFLLRKGFSYETVKKVLAEFL